MLLDIRAVVGVLGALLFFLGCVLLVPTGVALWYQEAGWWSFLVAGVLGCSIGGLAWWRYRPKSELRVREGFAVVTLSWVVLSLLGALPFVLSGVLDQYTDAFFETMSGFTTTGATILGGADTPPIEALPQAFLFWRSLTHWLGGMGIIVLTLAVLPLLGVGGMQLFKAEAPGPSADKLTPRVKETAKRLWMIYVGFTGLEVALLWPAMGGFDAVNHAFATMATGGFSTENGSVGQYGSAYIDWVIVLFMVLAGVNFALYYRLLRGKTGSVLKDEELRFYAAIVVLATALVTYSLYQPAGATDGGYTSFADALRHAAFQVVALVTTTGFGTADYELWPALAIGVVFLLFFVGGMAGSTGGGVKVVRHLLLYKISYREIKRLIHPQAILPLRLNGEVVPQEVLRNVLTFLVFYISLLAAGIFAMVLLGQDILTAIGASISCVGNIGPAFGTLGPTETYAHIPALGKWVLSFLMLAGRLEILTVLVLFMPTYWRR